MGCCFSSTAVKTTPKTDQDGTESPPREEAVKKVVISNNTPISSSSLVEEEKRLEFLVVDKQHETQKTPIVEEEKKLELLSDKQQETEYYTPEMSQLSDTCSYTESLSTTTTTTTTTTAREDEATSKPRRGPVHNEIPRKRLYSGDHGVGRGRGGVRERRRVPPQSPAKRVEPLPLKKKRVGNVGGDQLSLSSSSSSSRTIHQQPTRIRTPTSRMEAGSGVGRGRGQVKSTVHELTETLENPHVSLECFIFL
ncbi:hypothetical protein ACFE04_017365 [Oxalis oulophora]